MASVVCATGVGCPPGEGVCEPVGRRGILNSGLRGPGDGGEEAIALATEVFLAVESCSSTMVSLGALKFVGGCAPAAFSGGATPAHHPRSSLTGASYRPQS